MRYVVRWAMVFAVATVWTWLSVFVLDLSSPWPTVGGILVGLICWFLFDPFMQRTGR